MINGDKVKGLTNKLLYFLQSLYLHQTGANFNLEIFNVKLNTSQVCNNTKIQTPARILSDCFWNSINFHLLRNQLGQKLRILDIGCGSGKYGKFFKKKAGKNFKSYTGLDIYKHKNFPKIFTHKHLSATKISPNFCKSKNIFVSQSSLEHLKDDFFVLEKITANLVNKKFIQIHLIPSDKSLFLYFCHGWRQYSLNNLQLYAQKLNSKFNVKCIAVPLGNRHCFWIHFFWFTLPKYLKILTKIQHLQKKHIKNAIIRDNKLQKPNPLFWAFIIYPKNIKINFLVNAET